MLDMEVADDHNPVFILLSKYNIVIREENFNLFLGRARESCPHPIINKNI
jgi:hypothetical protein